MRRRRGYLATFNKTKGKTMALRKLPDDYTRRPNRRARRAAARRR